MAAHSVIVMKRFNRQNISPLANLYSPFLRKFRWPVSTSLSLRTVVSSAKERDGERRRNDELFERDVVKEDGGSGVSRSSEGRLTDENQLDVLSSYVTPLWGTPYSEQLNIKQRRMEIIMSQLARRLRDEDQKQSRRIACPVERIRPSPVQLAYRNKDEFSVNVGLDGNPKTVGMYVGDHSDPGGIVCVPPSQLSITKDSHKLVARLFQQYIRASPLPTCLQFSDGGHWRRLVVRSNSVGDLMAVIIIHPQQLTENAILEEQAKIKEFFAAGPGAICGLKSLHFQTCVNSRCTHEQSPFRLLLGESHIVETLASLRFRISPDSFFQTNTEGAEVLYDTLREFSHLDKGVGLLDVCCGTGTISLIMSKYVKQTLGMDVTRQAILDAKHNAELNGIKNSTFFTGKAEDLVADALKFYGRQDIIAIVNPSRGGLNYNVVNALRKCSLVYQVMYVSCNPEGLAMNDFARLCHPTDKRNSGKPFRLRRAIPVDMFPHTDHCELMLSFDRN